MKEAQHVLEASDIYKKFRELLNEMFQMNNADLDFGLYRIMNARRKEINRFLNEELLSQIDKVFEECIEVDKKRLEEELQKAIQKAKELGLENPEEVPQVKKIKERLKHAIDVTTTKIDVFSHLTTFFSRYYQDGDFVSLRRYKWDKYTYAIPYNGEEVKLYWANYDQYYIKTSEYFREYSFFVEFPDGKKGKVYFKVKDADSEKDNVKGKERFFIFKDLEIKDDELFVYFDYMPVEEKKKNLQQELNKETVKKILNFEKLTKDWKFVLSKEEKVKGNNKKTILEKHINKYTAKNKFDFFIHKDLGGFLKRELDFYIKNEVVNLYEFQNLPPDKVKEYLCKVKAIKLIGEKIIDFLAQLENFQKKLWLKKKFIWDTQYCITLDRIFSIEDETRREWLLEKIFSNKKQIEEWKTFYKVHELDEAPLFRSAWDNPSPENLRKLIESDPRLRYLVVDTCHFDEEFKLKLISSFDNLDEKLDGLLVHGENFQALNLLLERYRGQVKCIYIDPPYNSKTTEILYKNDYKHSSWLTLIDNRLALSRFFATEDGSHIIAIDENEQELLGRLLSLHFPEDHFEKICVSIIHNKKGIQGKYFSYNHDFAYFCIPHKLPQIHGKPIPKEEREYVNFRKWGRESERETARNCFYPIYVNIKNKNIVGFGDVCDENFHPGKANIYINDQIVAIYPVDQQGIERKWRYSRDSIEKIKHLLKVHITREGEIQILKANTEKQFKTVWDDPKYIAGDYGTRILTELGLKFDENLYPKSIYTVSDAIYAVSNSSDLILDYFAGSGTTAHAVINLNREDGGRRKYILVEVADYFNTVLLPRIKKVVFSRDWKDGKPKPDKKGNLNGVSHFFKYICLESYEDTLNNLKLLDNNEFEKKQKNLSSQNPSLREDFMLHYWIDFETKDSPSLLNVDTFKDPWKYELYIATDTVNERKKVPVDLVETFNYLIGLKVEHISEKEHVTAEFERDEYGKLQVKGRLKRCAPGEGWTFQTVEGTLQDGRKVLIVWRTLTDDLEKDNTILEAFFKKKRWNTRDTEYDLVYVNGMHTLENILDKDEDEKEAPLYKVQQIELEFKSRMFEVEDV